MKPTPPPPRSRQRRRVSLSSQQLVRTAPLQPDSALPLLVEPTTNHLSLSAWAQRHREAITAWLQQHGGLLLRGFHVSGAEDFGEFVGAIAPTPMSYTYRSTPRTHVRDRVYTSTEYPSDRAIPLHNEMAYAREWPAKIAFYCVQPAQTGGATPIADSRRVLARLDPEIRDRFGERGVLYVRNYGSGLDLSWQEVFQTQSRRAVEDYCRRAGMDWIWQGEDGLQTRQVCQAIAVHPQTGESVWFNQAHLFHIDALAPSVRENLLAETGIEGLPRHAYYGDGSEIASDVLARIREAYAAETVTFPWQAGDVLLLDNLLAAHGRKPFSGSRRVLAAMGDPQSSPDLGRTVLNLSPSMEEAASCR